MALVDRFLPAAAFAALLAREPQMHEVSFETARGDMDRLLDQAVEDSQEQRPEEVEDALFAVCAFADEAVLSSDWPGRGEWLKQSLQRLRFDTANAGEEFYIRLAALCDKASEAQSAVGGLPGGGGLHDDSIRRSNLREVLEIYAACLTLGFTGRYYGDKGRDRLAAITRDSLDRLMVHSPTLGTHLFPEAYAQRQPTPPPSRIRSALVLLALLGVPALTALYLHAAYASLLAAWVRDWLSAFT